MLLRELINWEKTATLSNTFFAQENKTIWRSYW